MSKSRKTTKLLLVQAHGGRCVLCGYDTSVRSLHFHHIDPSTKEFTLSGNTLVSARDRLYEETKKCLLVCSNCHGEIHDGLIDVSNSKSSALLDCFPHPQKKYCQGQLVKFVTVQFQIGVGKDVALVSSE
jgi:hypothetical protein